jgi:DNA-binding CsgD family transcriptional regulator
MRADLGTILSDLDTLNTEQAFKRKFAGTFANFGFNSFTYVGFKGDASSAPKYQPSDLIFLSNVRAAWIDHYLEHELYEDDPLFKECATSRLPFKWDEKFRANSRTPGESRVLTDGLDFGIQHGVTVPIHGPGGELGVMSLYSDLNEKAFASALQEVGYDVHLLSMHFHDAVQKALVKVEKVPKPIPLTEREVEILQWTATGKTAWEIGSILNISERTVNFHLQNAMGKFGVHNKVHAAAKAMSIGLISSAN